MPEILDVHNVYDFIDPDILQRLEELGRQEGMHQEQVADDDFEMDWAELTPEEQEALAEIRKKKSLFIQQHRMKKSTAESRPTVPRKFDKDRQFTSERTGRQLSTLGIIPTLAIYRACGKDPLTGVIKMALITWMWMVTYQRRSCGHHMKWFQERLEGFCSKEGA
ncbi:Nucleolar GTP-binding protein 1 [Forsythia ovata]|uniref:Nucleolar GTP-binding protein 1 n=1 Tax=Forsythia ovata TaxID=205694 RepID=A0ABD1X0M5_9LAMI